LGVITIPGFGDDVLGGSPHGLEDTDQMESLKIKQKELGVGRDPPHLAEVSEPGAKEGQSLALGLRLGVAHEDISGVGCPLRS